MLTKARSPRVVDHFRIVKELEVKPQPTVLKPRGNGARPGERRGGRGAGVKNKGVIDREVRMMKAIEVAVEALGDAVIQKMSMVDIMEFAARLAFRQGWIFKAAEIADKAAPYKNAKLANVAIDDHRKKDPHDYRDDDLQAIITTAVEMGYVREVHPTEQ